MSVRVAAMTVCIFFLLACSRPDQQLKPFSSDGCSLFPDADLLTDQDWCDCCLHHDVAYWKGGTEEQREQADNNLRDCVEEKTRNPVLASVMYEGVRVGGSPYFYNWYRWGYGWPYERKYQRLTAEEEALAQKLVDQFWRSDNVDVCDSP